VVLIGPDGGSPALLKAKIMKIENLNGMVIFESDGHGKACKGDKKTSGIQVRQYIGNGYLLLANFGFPINDKEAKNKAIEKARIYIKESTE